MKSQELESSLKKLPATPGVYFFLGRNKKILYIGKATSLRNRVRSYFTKDIEEKRSPLIAKMVEEAKSVSFQKTDSVLEALLLESYLIKKHTPPYNSADKDQKSFNYVIITDEDFPRVLIVRERSLKLEAQNFETQASFGPFAHGAELKEALKIIRRIFPFRDTCIPNQKRGCFNYQIGLCPGICAGKISSKDYKKNISYIKTFFNGNKKKLRKDLEKEMKSRAKVLDFEQAKEIKKKIFALKHIQDIALLKNKSDLQALSSKPEASFRIEAYDIAHISGKNMVGVMTVMEDGEINKNEYRKFIIKGQQGADDTKALREILERRIKHTEWPMPQLIVADGGVAQLNTVEKVLRENNLNINVVAVTKDERHKAKQILNIETLKTKDKNLDRQIILINSEAHRFAINYHKSKRDRLPR